VDDGFGRALAISRVALAVGAPATGTEAPGEVLLFSWVGKRD
jgi:hypothetical protein